MESVVMSCTHCGKEEKIVGRGLCRSCYTRWHRTGSLEYQRKGKPAACCSEEGCNNLHVARGYCEKHYRMWVKRGLPNSSFGYGERQTHPLYNSWCSTRRTKEGREPAWDDFWNFVNDVKDSKPEPSADEKYALSRVDIKKKFGPDNFYWRKLLPSTESSKEHQRRWRKLNPDKAKSTLLKKQFGIGLNDYIEMFERQGGKCYICGIPGNVFSEKKNLSTTLVVDHCHKTGKIRKLLCYGCNTGLGLFKDNPAVLRRAAAYIKEHSAGEGDVAGNLTLFDLDDPEFTVINQPNC